MKIKAKIPAAFVPHDCDQTNKPNLKMAPKFVTICRKASWVPRTVPRAQIQKRETGCCVRARVCFCACARSYT